MKREAVNNHIKARNHGAKCDSTIQHSRCENRWVSVSLELAWSTWGFTVSLCLEKVWKPQLQSSQSKALPRLLPTIYVYTLENVHEMNNSIETTNRQNQGEITVANIVLCAVCPGKFRIKLLGVVI